MGIKFGLRMMLGTETTDTLYCDRCDHYLGERHMEDGHVWYKDMSEEWNNCPYCGEPLELEWM